MSLILAPGQALYLTTGTPATNQALAMVSFAVPGGSPNSASVTATGTTPVVLAQSVYGGQPAVVSSVQVFNADTAALSVELTVQSEGGTTIPVYNNPSVPANGEVSYEGGGGWQLLEAGIPTESPQFPAVTANEVYAGPSSGSAALPSFRSLVAADLPTIPLSSLAPIAADTVVANATGSSAPPTAVTLGSTLAFEGGSLSVAPFPATTLVGNAASSSAVPGAITIGSGISLSSLGVLSATGSGGTVTSVGLSMPSDFTVAGSPVTSSGTLTVTRNTQNANCVFAGPSSGAAAIPTYRSLVVADLPSIAADTVLANATGSSASPTAVTLGSGLAFNAGQLTNTVSIPQDYISGLKMTWNSATSISVSSGAAYIPSLAVCFANSGTLTLSGLSLTASTWYHVYLYSNSGTAAIECVTTAPSSPYYGTARTKTGDTSRRYVGSVLTDASSNIYQFEHIGTTVKYECNVAPAPFAVLLGGSATTPTTVSCSSVMPVTAFVVSLLLTNADASASIAYANPRVNGGLTSSFMAYLNANSSMSIDLCTDASQNISYMWRTSPSGGNANIRVVGYTYER